MSRVVYYNISGALDFENELLKKWGVKDLELIEVKNGDDRDKPGAFLKAVEGCQGIVVEYFEVTRDVFSNLKGVKIIAVQGIGYSNVDVKAATDFGLAITNTPGFCTEEVAIHTVGLLIDCVRKITFLDRSVRFGRWDPFYGPETSRLAGMTAGLVFFGSIPEYMAPILKAMKLNIQVYAPTKTPEYLAGFGCKKVETLEELLKTSDFVSLHTPLIPKLTYHLIGEPELKLMKKSAFLINTARGSIINEAALVKALKEGWIGGAALDVIEDESNAKSGLFGLENCVITPHSAYVSGESLIDARIIVLKQLVEFLSERKAPANLVNKDVIEKLKL
jgi:D-3-phosphoglycerate dehydrogenase